MTTNIRLFLYLFDSWGRKGYKDGIITARKRSRCPAVLVAHSGGRIDESAYVRMQVEIGFRSRKKQSMRGIYEAGDDARAL